MINEDSAAVRRAFRRLCQRGAVLMGVVGVLYALLQYALSVDQWYLALLPVPLAVPLHRMMAIRRPFWMFATGLLLMSVLLVGLCSYATLTFGRSVGFHLILMAILPIIVVSGRLSAAAKWMIVVGFAVLLVGLDLIADDTPLLETLSPVTVSALRAVNIAVPALCTTNLVLHYFRRAARQHAALTRLAMIDPLTGLNNRRQMGAIAQRLIQERRRGEQSFAVVLCDLDDFKAINDAHGHEAGDRVLSRVSRELAQGVREIDSVGRWGGEEFLILLPKTDLAGAGVLAERLRQRVAALFDPASDPYPRVTMTMGVSAFRADDTLEKVVARADDALYAGKAAGRNIVVAETVLQETL